MSAEHSLWHSGAPQHRLIRFPPLAHPRLGSSPLLWGLESVSQQMLHGVEQRSAWVTQHVRSVGATPGGISQHHQLSGLWLVQTGSLGEPAPSPSRV